MTVVAPIGPMRVAGIRPAVPGPGAEPFDEGLDVDLLTEPTPVQLPPLVAPASAVAASDHDPRRAAGNARVTTAYDARPAVGDTAQRFTAAPTSPFERAMRAYALR